MLLNQTLSLCSRDNVITCQHTLLGDRFVLATEKHGSDEVEEEVRTETLFNLEVTLLAFGSDTDKHIIFRCDELEAIRNARETHDFALLVAIDVGLVELLVVVEVTVGVAVCTLIERLALLIAEEDGLLTSQLLVSGIDELLNDINRILCGHGCSLEEVALANSKIAGQNLRISDGFEAVVQLSGFIALIVALRCKDAVAECFAQQLEEVHSHQFGDRCVFEGIALHCSRAVDALNN